MVMSLAVVLMVRNPRAAQPLPAEASTTACADECICARIHATRVVPKRLPAKGFSTVR